MLSGRSGTCAGIVGVSRVGPRSLSLRCVALLPSARLEDGPLAILPSELLLCCMKLSTPLLSWLADRSSWILRVLLEPAAPAPSVTLLVSKLCFRAMWSTRRSLSTPSEALTLAIELTVPLGDSGGVVQAIRDVCVPIGTTGLSFPDSAHGLFEHCAVGESRLVRCCNSAGLPRSHRRITVLTLSLDQVGGNNKDNRPPAVEDARDTATASRTVSGRVSISS